MKTIRASEVGTYVFCQRAWWYYQQGVSSENQAELASGSDLHARHGRAVLRIGCLRALAYGMILLAFVLAAIYLTNLVL